MSPLCVVGGRRRHHRCIKNLLSDALPRVNRPPPHHCSLSPHVGPTGLLSECDGQGEEVALSLGLTLLRHYPELLAARFGGFPRPCDEHGLLAFIATSRHLVKAGAPDLARAATTVLHDFRSSALGRISLETIEG